MTAPLKITYDRYSLMINGRREFIRSGAMHYFRLPSQELWRDRLFKLKAAGYNTVDLYFCWNYHSPAQGVYDFTGIRDVRKLLEITQELGLYVIARPGPYINAEYSGGGFPGWLLAKKDLPLRHRREGAFVWSDEYMAAVREWWGQIIPILNTAPNIILMQIENEYATLEAEPDYMQAMYDMTREMGVTVPLFHNDLFVAGLYEDIVDIYAFDNYSVTQFETDWREMPEIFQVLDNVENNLRPFCQNRPLMAAELQAGWFGTWKGYKYEKITELLGREHIGISTKSLLGQGLTIYNHYKAIGGTNWDYIGSIETYTSYDFGAPISEAGINTERLFEAKTLNWFLQSFDLSATDRRDSFPLSLSHTETQYAVRSLADAPDAHWLWLRNLTCEPSLLTVAARYPVEVRPFEVLILPYRIPLKCGYELAFSTTEPLYQNETTLVLKADRALMTTIRAASGTVPEFDCDSAEVELVENENNLITFQCRELPESAVCRIRLGKLTVILLGKQRIDTFWVQPDGVMVVGPEMRLPDHQYGLARGNLSAHRIASDGGTIESFRLPVSDTVTIPPLRHWEIFDEAPELTQSAGALSADFRPVNGDADFDANGLYEGAAWYRLPLNGNRPDQITINARHLWAAFVNGRFIGQGQQLVLIHGLEAPAPQPLSIPAEAWRNGQENELLIFVSGLGHPKGFHDDAQTPQGLLALSIDGTDHTRQAQIAGDFASRRQPASRQAEQSADFKNSPVVRLRTSFSLPSDEQVVAPWGLKLQALDYERINLYLNGILIGRSWRECQCQEVFYLPTGILKTDPAEQNVLELILMNFQPFIDKNSLAIHSHQVMLHPYGMFTRHLFS